MGILDKVNGAGGRKLGPVCDLQSMVRAVAGLEDAMEVGPGWPCGVTKFPLQRLHTACSAQRHLYAEDLMWLFGEEAVLLLATPAFKSITHDAGVPTGLRKPQLQLPVADLLELWSQLSSHTLLHPGVAQRVWEFRIVTLMVNSLTRYLQGRLDRECKRPKTQPRVVTDAALADDVLGWSWLCVGYLDPFLKAELRAELTANLSPHANLGEVFQTLCGNGEAAAENFYRFKNIVLRRATLAGRNTSSGNTGEAKVVSGQGGSR
jgi:hypothetical protein